MKRIKTFNDVLALVLGVMFPTLWVLHGLGTICLPDIALGATITLETLIVQFYFRRAPETPVGEVKTSFKEGGDVSTSA